MSGIGHGRGGPAASTPVTMGCHGCSARADVPAWGAMPDAWDGFFETGRGWRLFCADCVADGGMLVAQASALVAGATATRERWRYPNGLLAMYKPRSRSILLATPQGFAELDEAEAEQLHAALGGALDIRAQAEGLTTNARPGDVGRGGRR